MFGYAVRKTKLFLNYSKPNYMITNKIKNNRTHINFEFSIHTNNYQVKRVATVNILRIYFDTIIIMNWSTAVFPLTLWLIGKCPNFLLTFVPKALKRRLCALNFVPIRY